MKKMNRILAFLLALALFVSSFAGSFSVEASAEETTTRVYFYNSDSWGNVYAYTYNGADMGGWPGTAATGEGNGWYYVDVPGSSFTIIFNNNSGAQTADTNISGTVYMDTEGVYGSKAEVEAKYAPQPVTTRVYFYNSGEWGSVYAHVYNTDEGVNTTWPGMAATSEGNGWYYVDVTAVDAEFTVIFNNNSGSQTADTNISGTVYMDTEGVYGSKAEVEAKYAPEEPVTTRVYFYNSSEWSAVNGYVYGSCGEVLNGWPGTAATNEGDGWCYVDVPASPEFTIIFNDGGSNQTASVNINGNVYVGMDGVACATKAEVEAKYAPQPVTTRVYFYNSSDWGIVYAHIYNTDESVNTAWPGVAATNEEGTKWWYVDVTAVDTEFTIIFNDGGSNQSADVNISDKFYVDLEGAYASREEVEAKYAPQPQTIRVYFYNSSDWSSVYAHVYNTDEGVNTTWPGMAATNEEGTKWWYVDVTAVDKEFTIIFNNNSGAQTADVNISENVYVAINGVAYETKEAAEAAVQVPDVDPSTTVWFYNSNGWATVNAYVYGASNGEVLGTWPGKAATRDGETDWWSVEVPADPQFTIIFNDGGSNQTADVNIIDNVYVAMDGVAYATKEDAEAAVGDNGAETNKTVWFYNSDNWTTVNAYVYITNPVGSAAEPLGGWPGAAATRDGETDWWHVNVPVETEFTIIFNDGGSNQTASVNINSDVYVGMDGIACATKAEVEAKYVTEEPVSTRVYFYNSSEWSAVNGYVYGSCGEVLNGWPGTAATNEGNGWWYVDVPASPEFTIIFNDGGSNQTASVNIIENVYVAMDGVAYATKEAAEAAVKVPEEPVTMTIWFYNNQSWDAVAVHIYNEAGTMFGDWPGAVMNSNGDGWYYLEVNVDTLSQYYTVIFNNNGAGAQLAGVDVPTQAAPYFADGTWYATKEAAEEAVKVPDENPSTTVWFYNSNGWATVNAYVYGASNGEALGTWPGTAATRDGSTNWWSVEVPADPQFTIIFNDGAGAQSKDVSIVDETNVYVTVSGTTPYASREAAEESLSGSGTPGDPGESESSTTIWFYNSNDWTNVNAYVYGASNGEALGTWPGKAATRDGSTNWWSVEVPADPQFTIIFNDGAGAQSKDVSIADETNVYVTVSGTTPFATREAAEESVANAEPASTIVWFYNSDGWASVNAYVYGASTADPMGAWPGTAAVKDGDSDWWYVEVPVNPEFVIIFNNGSGAQSMDVAIEDEEQVYVTVTGSDAYADKETAEAAQKVMDEDRKGTVRVWFYNSEGWAYVYAYVYGSVQADPLGTWPGTRATRNGERWWYIDIDVDRPFYVIFNNGSDSQSPDTQITDSTNVYVTMNKDGAYASKQEAEASIATLKPIISATTTVWFYNNLGWKNVCAYAWGTANTDPLGAWPGSQAMRYEDTDWWYFTCNFPAPFYIIFNDGVEGGAQTQGVHITDSWNVYTTYQANKKYASMEEAEASVGKTTRVYFYNSNGWSEVYAYGWGGVQGENFGAWPGTLATRENKDSYWYYVEILAGTQLNIIFNNGVDEQTNGVLIDDNENLYVTVNDEKFANKADAEATIENVAEILPVRANRAYTVWYSNSANWDNVYLYVENAEGEAFFGSEPGIKMHRLGNTGWFYMNVATGFDFTVKFSDGADAVTSVFTVSDKANTYFTFDGQYTSKNEAMGLTEEPTDPVEPPVQEEPVKDEGSGSTGLIAGGSVISLLVVGGYAWILMMKRKKQATV